MRGDIIFMDESTLLSIKEFAEFTGVNQSTLRYYDEIGILPPAERGDNNYRYYVPYQIIKLNYINVLVDLGVPLSMIKELNDTRTPENVIDLLSHQESNLDAKLNELRTAYSIIHTFRKNIQDGIMAHEGLIRLEYLDETRYVPGGLNDLSFKTDASFYSAFIKFCKSADKRRINLRYPVGAYHEDISGFLNTPNRPERYISLDPLGNSVRPKGKYLVAYKRGYYGVFGDIAQEMADYALENELVMKGPVFVIYLLDEISIAEPEDYLARISVGVSAKKQTKIRKN